MPWIGIALVGGALGAEMDLLAYLVSRYFGLKHYAAIYAALYVFHATAMPSGAMVFSTLHDVNGDYVDALRLGAALLLGSALIFSQLGPYPGDERNVRDLAVVAKGRPGRVGKGPTSDA